MRTLMSGAFKFLVISIIVIASATAGDRYYVPSGLDANFITKTFLTRHTKPNSVFAELAGARLVRADVLLFRASVDNRPLVIDMCVVGSEILRGDTREWLLMTFYRHPYGMLVMDTEWTLGWIRGLHSDRSLRRLTERPTNKTIQEFLQWSRWDALVEHDFKDIQYLCFPAAWRSFTGGEPIQLKDAVLWPPKD